MNPPHALALPSARIAVVGCGAVGGFYGARLWRAGLNPRFLLRSDFDVVSREGFRIESADGAFVARPVCARAPEDVGPCDLVIVAIKSTANAALEALLAPLLGAETAVLTLQNGLGNEELLAGLFGAHRVLGGLCFVCLNRVRPGCVRHIAHGQVTLGESSGPAGARAHAIAALFHRGGVSCAVTDSLERARWEKLVWNIPFNGLGVAAAAGFDSVVQGRLPPGFARGRGVPVDVLLADARWLALVRELMDEVLSAATALGHELPASCAEDRIQQTRLMGSYKASTVLDYERGQELELGSIFLEPLRRADAAGAAAPRLRALCSVLAQISGHRWP